jgi:hypothetical protein
VAEAKLRAEVAEAKLRAAGSGGTSWISTAAKVADFGRTLADAVIAPIKTLIAALPLQFAKAVREYDEAEAVRVAADAADTLLERQVNCCRTCTEIGKLEGFDFDARQNKIYCLDCQRYGAYAPKKYTRGAQIWGVFDGQHAAREFKTVKLAVKLAVKRHILHSLHRWCEIHAVEEAARTRKTTSVGMTCAPLPSRAPRPPCALLPICPCARLTRRARLAHVADAAASCCR